MPNSFSALPRQLLVIAHDLDLGEEVLFGAPGFEHVPVTRACTASMALPPFFSPVCVGDRYYIDAGAAQSRVLDAAARAQARALVIVNPMVPVRTRKVPTGHGERPSLRDKGAMWVANQAHRISTHALLTETIERLRRETRMQVICMLVKRDFSPGEIFTAMSHWLGDLARRKGQPEIARLIDAR